MTMGSLRDRWYYVMLFIVTIGLMPFDSKVIPFVRSMRQSEGFINDLFASVMPVATFLGHGSIIVLIGLLLFALGKTLKKSEILLWSKYILIGFLTSGILAQLIKHLLGRARPRLTDDLLFIGPGFISGFDSFPSGHTAVVFCIATLFTYRYRGYAPFLFVLATFTGIERVYNLSHFPSDVVAGILTGVASAEIVKKWFLKGETTSGEAESKNSE